MYDYLAELLVLIAAHAFGAAFGTVAGIVSGLWWLAETVWILIVRAFLYLIEWADERWYDLQIADSPLLRAVVAGIAGFILALAVLWLGAVFMGHWGLSCAFVVIIAFTLFVGFMADPDKAWAIPPFPWDKGGGPKIPVNL
jgi:hypothetical protein